MPSVRSWGGWRRRRRCRIGRWCRRGGCCGPPTGWPTRRSRGAVGWTRTRCGGGVPGSPSTVSRGVGVIAQGPWPQVEPARRASLEEVLRLTHKGSAPPTGRRSGVPAPWLRGSGIGKDAIAKIWADHKLEAVAGRDVQGEQRSALRSQTRRCCWTVCESTCASGGVQLRREDPMPGFGPYSTVAADESGPRWNHDS